MDQYVSECGYEFDGMDILNEGGSVYDFHSSGRFIPHEHSFEYFTPEYECRSTAGLDFEHKCEDDDCVEYNVKLPHIDGVNDGLNRGFGRQYAGFYHVAASRTHCPFYAHQGHHPTSHSPRKQPQKPSQPALYVPPHLRQYDTQNGLCYPSSMRKTAAQSNFDAKLDLLVREQEVICRDMDSLKRRLNRLIEKEERGRKLKDAPTNLEEKQLVDNATVERSKELEGAAIKFTVSLPCLEGQKLSHDAVFSSDSQDRKREVYSKSVQRTVADMGGRQETFKDDLCSHTIAMVSLDQFITTNSTLAVEKGTDIVVEINQEKKEKAEQSVGFKNAMRCLEIQRKFWAIGSSFSVIPAVPLHQIMDPFYECVESKQQLQQAVFWPLNINDIWPAKAQGLHGMECNNFCVVSWTECLRAKGVEVILYAWFGTWRPPDLLFRHWGLESSMLGFWFDRGRPPDNWGCSCPPRSFEDEALQTGMD